MARKKKDGWHINYYIERSIYDRLKQYAEEKGQPMTTAIERILDDYLPKSAASQGEHEMGTRLNADK